MESRRVNGKPRPIPLLHLGTADQLRNRLLPQAHPQFTLRSYPHGDGAALQARADRLGWVALIDPHCPTSRRPLSLGTTLGLAALKRALWPCSKRAWASWAPRTSVPRLFDRAPATLTRQDLGAPMEAIAGRALAAIEADLTRTVVHDLQLRLDTLFYDTSNCCTYLDRGNERCPRAPRGRSNQQRFALRQFSLALLVTRDGPSPLSADGYEGNTGDATRFPPSLTAMRPRVERRVGPREALTLVYDKGNHAKAQQAVGAHLPVPYVASLVPPPHPELRALPTAASTPLEPGPVAQVPVDRCRRPRWGAERTVVLFLSSQLRQGHSRGRHQQLTKRLEALQQWQQR